MTDDELLASLTNKETVAFYRSAIKKALRRVQNHKDWLKSVSPLGPSDADSQEFLRDHLIETCEKALPGFLVKLRKSKGV